MSKQETIEQTAILEENGIIVVTPSAELMAGLKEIGASMLEEWKKDAGPEGAALLEAYRAE